MFNSCDIVGVKQINANVQLLTKMVDMNSTELVSDMHGLLFDSQTKELGKIHLGEVVDGLSLGYVILLPHNKFEI